MKLTILETGHVPEPLRDRFAPYPDMFATMLARTGADITTKTVNILAGQALPDPADLEGVLITGSPAGVYDDLPWMNPLRDFIRKAHGQTKMVGICFGHQIIADALGGEVRKSEKGWGLGRHRYLAGEGAKRLGLNGEAISIACSHQDQVIVPPTDAEVIHASEFTPNAGLLYRNGRTLSFQPHPEFADEYALALIELRRGNAPEAVIEKALGSMQAPSDSTAVASAIARFLSA